MLISSFSLLINLALSIGVAALGFYILYRVVRAAVRDGIREAREHPTDREP